MNLPVKYENGAEQSRGTGSLELVRANMRQLIQRRTDLAAEDKEYILKELDCVIEGERQRRARLATYQLELEALDHRIDQVRKASDIACYVRTKQGQAEREIAQHAREIVNGKLDIAERIIRLREKYKPVPVRDEHQEEIDSMKKRQSIADMRENAALNSVTERALKRAAFVKKVQAEFPDMSEELIDYYDQQVFQRGARR